MSLNLDLIYSEFNLNVVSDSDKIVYLFEEYRLDVSRRMLYRGREEIALPPKAIETLLALIELRGEIVSKDDLMKIIWSDAIVEDSNLAHYLHVLRKTLGNKLDGKPFIETFRRRGYRFTSEVKIIEEPETQKNGGRKANKESNISQIEHWKRASSDVSPKGRDNSKKDSGFPRGILPNRQMLSAAAAFTGFFVLATLLYFMLPPFRNDSSANIRSELSMTKLTDGQMVQNAAISTDGKYFVYHEMEGEKTRLWLQQTGQTARIEIIPPSELLIGGKTFTPNGEYIYFPGLEKGETKISLYRVLPLGGTLTKILTDIESPVAFSPDGSEMIFIRNDRQTMNAQMVTAAANGGSERVLLTANSSQSFSTSGVGWSPDGKFIAFGLLDKTLTSGEGSCSISAVDLQSGAVRNLSNEKWDTCYRMVWTTDGAGLVFTGTRAGESYSMRRDAIYYLSIADGTARCITNDGNRYQNQSLSLTKNNSLLVVPSKRMSQIWVMNSNGDSRTAVQLSNGQADGRAGVASMADGRIGFISRFGENLSLWTMKADGSDQRQTSNYLQYIENLNATPDGQYFIFSARRDGFSHLYRIDTDGANLRQLTDGDRYEIDSTVSPDSRWIFYDSHFYDGSNWKSELRKTAIDGSETIVLRQFEKGSLIPQISPDGRLIVALADGAFRLFSASDGALVGSVQADKQAQLEMGAKWFPDGKSLTYMVNDEGSLNIWQHSLDGSAPRPLTDFSKGNVYQYAFSKDGTRLYLSRGYQSYDAVLIRNFQ